VGRFINCRCCGAGDAELAFVKDGHEVAKCSRCGLVYLNLAPTEDQLRRFYSETYFVGDSGRQGYLDYVAQRGGILATARKRLKTIDHLRPNGKRLLDVGCAMGFFLEAARETWETFGIELSAYAADYARNRLGLSVTTGALPDCHLAPGSFDVITMWDVIEHVPNPCAVMQKANELLRGEGLLVLSTGDVDSLVARVSGTRWHLFNVPQHLSFFSKQTIARLLEQQGFRVLYIEHSGSFYTVGYLSYRMRTCYQWRLWQAVDSLLHGLALKDLKVYVNLGDVMTVYAEKAEPP